MLLQPTVSPDDDSVANKKRAKKERQRQNKVAKASNGGGGGAEASGLDPMAEAPKLHGRGGAEASGLDPMAEAPMLHGRGGVEASGLGPMAEAPMLHGRGTNTGLNPKSAPRPLRSWTDDQDSSDESDGHGGGDGEQKNKLFCSVCNKTCHPSFFLVSAPDQAHWCGKIWGKCQSCSDYVGNTQRVFRRATRKAWLALREYNGHKYERARALKFSELDAHFEKILPGIPHNRRRELCKLRLRCLVARVVSDTKAQLDELMGRAPQQAEDFKLGLASIAKEYMDELKACADDPLHAPTAHSRGLLADECQYMTMLSENCGISFVCRDMDCLFFLRATIPCG